MNQQRESKENESKRDQKRRSATDLQCNISRTRTDRKEGTNQDGRKHGECVSESTLMKNRTSPLESRRVSKFTFIQTAQSSSLSICLHPSSPSFPPPSLSIHVSRGHRHQCNHPAFTLAFCLLQSAPSLSSSINHVNSFSLACISRNPVCWSGEEEEDSRARARVVLKRGRERERGS